MSLDAFPADPELPQLNIATDPGLMRQVFREHLCQLPGRTYHVQDCLLSWVRYFRGARCTLQYTLRLAEPQTGHKWNQWVTSGTGSCGLWSGVEVAGQGLSTNWCLT